MVCELRDCCDVFFVFDEVIKKCFVYFFFEVNWGFCFKGSELFSYSLGEVLLFDLFESFNCGFDVWVIDYFLM